MDAGRDGYNQQVEVRFSGVGAGPAPKERQGVSGALRKGLAALPAFLASLRKAIIDLAVAGVVVAAAILFTNVLTDDAVVFEAPSVPQAVQDRGITPALLTQMVKARVRQIHEIASHPETVAQPVAPPREEVAKTVRTLEDVINAIFAEHGEMDATATSSDPDTAEANRILEEVLGSGQSPAPRGGMGQAGMDNDPDSLVARMNQLTVLVAEELQQAVELNKPAEVSSPVEQPLVVATAGLQFSLTSLARTLRPIFRTETDRRLTMTVVCKTQDCRGDSLSLFIATQADKATAVDAVDLNASRLDRAVDAAARRLLGAFDPLTLATLYYRENNLVEAERLGERIAKEDGGRSVWAANMLGLVALRRDRLEEAGHYFETALEIDPNYVPTQINAGIVHFRRGQFKAAEASYRRALDLGADRAVAYNNLGNVLARQCDWEAAAEAWVRALAADPRSPSAGRGLVLVRSFPKVRNLHLAALSKALVAGKRPAGGTDLRAKPVTLADVMAYSEFCEGMAAKPEPK